MGLTPRPRGLAPGGTDPVISPSLSRNQSPGKIMVIQEYPDGLPVLNLLYKITVCIDLQMILPEKMAVLCPYTGYLKGNANC